MTEIKATEIKTTEMYVISLIKQSTRPYNTPHDYTEKYPMAVAESEQAANEYVAKMTKEIVDEKWTEIYYDIEKVIKI